MVYVLKYLVVGLFLDLWSRIVNFWTKWHVYEVHNMSGLSDSCSWNDNPSGTWLAIILKIISAVQIQHQLCYLSKNLKFSFLRLFWRFWAVWIQIIQTIKMWLWSEVKWGTVFGHMFILGQIILFCLMKYYYIV